MSGLRVIFSEIWLPFSSWPIRWLPWCQTSLLHMTAPRQKTNGEGASPCSVYSYQEEKSFSQFASKHLLLSYRSELGHMPLSTPSSFDICICISFVFGFLCQAGYPSLAFVVYIYVFTSLSIISLSGLFHWLWCSPGPSMLSQGCHFLLFYDKLLFHCVNVPNCF